MNVNFEDQRQNVKKGIADIRISKWLLLLLIPAILVIMYVSMPILNPVYVASINFLFVLCAIIYLVCSNSKRKLVYIVIAYIILIVVINICTTPILWSSSYKELIGAVNTVNYEDEKLEIDNDLIPVVDKELAENLGDKKLGESIGVSSQYYVGEYNLVNTAEDLVWVAPLEPSSFFKWFQNKNGAPGYIYVSATNPNDVRYVSDINGDAIEMKYTQKAYFNNNVKRHAYFNGNLTTGMTDYSFEIDDAGNPYWIITKYAPSFNIFAGEQVSGVIIMDAQSGEVTNYDDLSQVPDWVERIYPEDLIYEQINYYGKYVNGWLNTLFSQKDMLVTTSGYSYLSIDHEPYMYTGLTSIQSDEATVGIMITSLKDKNTTFYKLTGATEVAAMQSAKGALQQYDYTPSFPVLLNEYDKPTYFMTLKDDSGLVKQYAFVSVENYNIVGIGDTFDKALIDYQGKLKENGALTIDESTKQEQKGVVQRINIVNSIAYIKLENDETIYVIDDIETNSVYLTQAGDTITFETVEGSNSIYNFENKSL